MWVSCSGGHGISATTMGPAPLLTLSSHLSHILAPIHVPVPPPIHPMWSCDHVCITFVCYWVAHTLREGLGVKYIMSVAVYAAAVSLFIILYLQQKPFRLLWVLY